MSAYVITPWLNCDQLSVSSEPGMHGSALHSPVTALKSFQLSGFPKPFSSHGLWIGVHSDHTGIKYCCHSSMAFLRENLWYAFPGCRVLLWPTPSSTFKTKPTSSVWVPTEHPSFFLFCVFCLEGYLRNLRKSLRVNGSWQRMPISMWISILTDHSFTGSRK